MRTHTLLLSVLALASTVGAQTPINLPAYDRTFTSGLTRGLYFQCPVACYVSGLEVPNEANQPNQVVEVIDFGVTAPPAFPGNVTGTQLFYDNATPSGTLIPTNIPLVAGNWYGVLGACNDSPGSATSYNSYGTPVGPFVSDILGNPVTLARIGAQSGIASNGGNQPVFSEDGGPIGRVFVHIVRDPPECWLFLGFNQINFPLGNANDRLLTIPYFSWPVTQATMPQLQIPNDGTLGGAELFFQIFMLNPVQYPNDPIKLTNGMRVVLGDRGYDYGPTSGMTVYSLNNTPLGGTINLTFSIQ